VQDNATQDPATVTEANKAPPFPFNVSEYEQQYDSRGYAENLASKELSRQSRRAQNDVLATVGVCVNEKSLAKSNQATSEKSEIQQIMAENVDGLLLTTADSILLCSAIAWATGLKQRLQVSTWPAHCLSPAKWPANDVTRRFASILACP